MNRKSGAFFLSNTVIAPPFSGGGGGGGREDYEEAPSCMSGSTALGGAERRELEAVGGGGRRLRPRVSALKRASLSRRLHKQRFCALRSVGDHPSWPLRADWLSLQRQRRALVEREGRKVGGWVGGGRSWVNLVGGLSGRQGYGNWREQLVGYRPSGVGCRTTGVSGRW